MMLRVTALFDPSQDAGPLRDALQDHGFETVVIDRESTQLSATDKLSADDLVQLGLASEEAAYFADAIQRGAMLVMVLTDDARTDEIYSIMERFELRQMPSSKQRQRLRFHKTDEELAEDREVIDESGFHRPEYMRKEFQRADSERFVGEHESGDATGLSRRAHGESRARLPEPFGRYEAACRDHFEEYLEGQQIPYRDFAKGYHYGMVLAQNPSFRNCTWNQIERQARQGWDSYIDGDWEDYRDAVRYGWRLIRGDEDQPRLKI